MSSTSNGNGRNNVAILGIILAFTAIFIGIAFSSLSTRVGSCETKADSNMLTDAKEHRDFQEACRQLNRVDEMVSWMVIKHGGNPIAFGKKAPVPAPEAFPDDAQDR